MSLILYLLEILRMLLDYWWRCDHPTEDFKKQKIPMIEFEISFY